MLRNNPIAVVLAILVLAGGAYVATDLSGMWRANARARQATVGDPVSKRKAPPAETSKPEDDASEKTKTPAGERDINAEVRRDQEEEGKRLYFDAKAKERRKGRAEAGAGTGEDVGSEALSAIFNMFLLTVAFVGVMVLFFWGVRKLLPGTQKFFSSDQVQILGRNFLSSKQSIVLVRVGERVLVLGVTGEHMRTLAEITDPEEQARIMASSQREGSIREAFNSVFHEAQKRLKRARPEELDAELYTTAPKPEENKDGVGEPYAMAEGERGR